MSFSFTAFAIVWLMPNLVLMFTSLVKLLWGDMRGWNHTECILYPIVWLIVAICMGILI